MDTIKAVWLRLNAVSQNNIRIMSATKLGKFDNKTVLPMHFPRTADLASLLVYFDNFGHHTAAVIAGRVKAGMMGDESDRESVDHLRTSIRTSVTHAAKALFEFAYPNQRGEWESRPWLFTGVNSEPAMLECGVILLRELAGLVYINSGSPISSMLLPNIELIAESMKLIFSMETLSIGPLKYRGLSIEDWKANVAANVVPLVGNDANRRIPSTIVKPSLEMAAILSAVARPSERTGAEAALYGGSNGLPVSIKPMDLVAKDGRLFIAKYAQNAGDVFNAAKHYTL